MMEMTRNEFNEVAKKEISKFMNDKMDEKGIGVKHLSNLTHIPESSIRNYMKGRTVPNAFRISMIGKILGKELFDILDSIDA